MTRSVFLAPGRFSTDHPILLCKSAVSEQLIVRCRTGRDLVDNRRNLAAATCRDGGRTDIHTTLEL